MSVKNLPFHCRGGHCIHHPVMETETDVFVKEEHQPLSPSLLTDLTSYFNLFVSYPLSLSLFQIVLKITDICMPLAKLKKRANNFMFSLWQARNVFVQ